MQENTVRVFDQITDLEDLCDLIDEGHRIEATRFGRILRENIAMKLKQARAARSNVITPENMHDQNRVQGQIDVLEEMCEDLFGLGEVLKEYRDSMTASDKEFMDAHAKYPKDIASKAELNIAQHFGLMD